jgi:alkylation response protein AidB-like acyl-CoA dehydrogenase
MNLSYTPEETAFRREVREFVAENIPACVKDKRRQDFTKRQEYLAWHRVLYRKGWISPSWPRESGGTGWTVVQRYIFDDECAKAGAPQVLPFGLTMCGPVLLAYGNDAQKRKFLPRILSGEDWWCQGYSEPGAGSDLANLKTTAAREGDHYIVNGQKTWITLAQFADWMFCLVRTDRITFLLIDMKTPGITIRPLRLLDGSHEVSEVFFDNVKVPVENRVGEENKGWAYATGLLSRERSGIAGVAQSKMAIRELRNIAVARSPEGVPLRDSDEFAAKIARVEIDLTALEYTELRTLSSEARHGRGGPESSILKLRGTEIQQRIAELTLEAVGYYGYPDLRAFARGEHAISPDSAAGQSAHYFKARSASIYGGTSEIQRNIIARAILGL